MRKLALEAFKTAGIKKGTLETTVAGDAIKAKSGKSGGSTKTKDAEFKAGDLIKYKAGSGTDTIEINGVVTSADGMDEKSSFVNITKIITLPQTPSAVAYDWKVGQKVSLYKKYMTKLGEKTTFKDTAQFKVGDLVRYVNDSNGNDVEGVIDSVESLGYYNIKITKANKLAANVKIGDIVASSAKYMTKISSDVGLKIGDVGTLDIQGNIYEVKILGQASENSFKISIIKPIEIKYKGFAVGVGKDMFVGTNYLKSAFKSYSDASSDVVDKEEDIKVGDTVTFEIQDNKYQGVVTEKVTNDTLRVKVEKTLEKKNNYVEVGRFVTMNRIYLKRVSK
jgi:plastocyanin